MLVGNIVDGAKRMRDLLADLLAYTDLTARPQAPGEAVDLNSVVEAVKQNLNASIDESRAVITTDHLPVLSAHAGDFVSVFQNLIANAIKYRSDDPPRIHVAAEEDGAEIRFAVSDNGIGIEPQFHRQIFEPFKRLHNRNIPGSGLGLAICQRVINRYGGRIWIESKLREGTTFRFALPTTLICDQTRLAPCEMSHTIAHPRTDSWYLK